MYSAAVAGQAVAKVLVGDDVHRVDLAAVQVVKGDTGAVGEQNVGVAVPADRHHHVEIGAVAARPADRAHVVLTLDVGFQVEWHAGG